MARTCRSGKLENWTDIVHRHRHWCGRNAWTARASKAARILDLRCNGDRREWIQGIYQKFPPTLVPFGGKFLVRAGQTVAAQSAFLPRFSVRMALSRDVAVPISQRVPQTVDVQTLVPTASPEATRKSRCTLVDPTFTANEGSKRFIMRFVLGTVTEHSRPF